MSNAANSTLNSPISAVASDSKQPSATTMFNLLKLADPTMPMDVFDYGKPEQVFDAASDLLKGVGMLATVRSQDFVNFGQRTSHTYRKDFMMKTSKLSAEARVGIILLFTAVKNKNRVLNEAKNLMVSDYPWIREATTFISTNMVQYVTELERQPTAFAGVHVPHILPSLTTLCWISLNNAPNSSLFLENLWACQMNIPQNLKTIQMEWEKNFWDNEVTSSRNTSANSYIKGFQQKFWDTKAVDNYPFLTYNSEEVVITDVITLDAYLALMKKFAPTSKKLNGFMLSPARVYIYAEHFKLWQAMGFKAGDKHELYLQYLSEPINALIKFEEFKPMDGESSAAESV